jgi:hypothetical protein
MNLTKLARPYAEIPISRHLVMEMLSEYKRPNDKISDWVKKEELISLRRGLYIPGPASELPVPEPFLIANHLRGPSYVSLESALSYWGFLPERVYETTSVTIKTSKKYATKAGRFSFLHLPTPYYSFGITSVALTPKQTVLMATPEKALCDKIILTSGISLRSIRQTNNLLLHDLRLDIALLPNLNIATISSWLSHAPKKASLEMLIKTLQSL